MVKDNTHENIMDFGVERPVSDIICFAAAIPSEGNSPLPDAQQQEEGNT